MQSWQQYVYKQQVRVAAQYMAADIRRVQQDAVYYGDFHQRMLKTFARGAPHQYDLYENTNSIKRVTFSSIDCQGVYLQQGIQSLAFSNFGAPRSVGTYVLRHKKVDNFSCVISVQPVTGRVIVTEGS